jgi:deoxyadenosine/deoxycytidine kinase
MSERSLKHIAISGNIGSGKTTLATMLSRYYGWSLMLEKPEENPYLRDFYKEMSRWAFHAQIHFLSSRFRQATHILNTDVPVVQDRSIEEDAYIFAANLHESGFLNNRDYNTYLDIFEVMIKLVRPPGIRIYLKADISTLSTHIKMRGNEYEAAISTQYLENLNHRYERLADSWGEHNLLVINMNKVDFVTREEDFKTVISLIDEHINREFPKT